jgi:hypothetical protein
MQEEPDMALIEWAERNRRASDPVDRATAERILTNFSDDNESVWTISIEAPNGAAFVWTTSDADIAQAAITHVTDLFGASPDVVTA